MPIIEKLGSFFLGREYDLKTHQILADRPVNYDARDLTTHAMVVGMTGSGKTGLCITLMEEAALDGVPAIMIDPKGDITNLLLTFPDLRPEDFLPWVNPDDARRKGQTPEEYAAATARTWREGLASWEEGPERIRALKEAADFAIYTPGSEAGLPVSILSSFKAPALDWDTETETLRDRIQGTVSGLLGLIGVAADPVRSREHILLSTIFETAWRAGQDLDIAQLIMQVQKPPFRQIGVFDVDAFFPEKERFGLAMALNNIIASPSFAAWTQGEPLDIGSLFYTATGKPRHTIFYIAHLSDAERMFFVTLLLEQIISWMRAQPGTTSLRGLVYMDEIFGFFPPTANPPSKKPMMTLLKQARAFGLGIVLTTQNPVDLDYKGLTNTGTWFVGKLQAERDKARLMDGLESALAEAGAALDRATLDRTISALDNRVFLMHNVNLRAPVIFYTRWAMSYLRGPLTRQQIKTLMAPRKARLATPKAAEAPTTTIAARGTAAGAAGLMAQPPVLPSAIKQVYLPVALTESQGVRQVADRVGGSVTPIEKRLVYTPALIGFASVRFVDRKLALDETQDITLLLPLDEQNKLISWKDARPVHLDPRELADRPERDGLFVADLPTDVTDARAFGRLAAALADHLYQGQSYTLSYNPALKLYSRPGESERDFKIRCQQAAREQRDAAVDKLRAKYQVQFDRLEDKLDRERRELAENEGQLKGRIGEEVLSGLATVAGALGVLGRRSSSLRGLTSVATRRRITAQAQANVAAAKAEIARLQAQVEQLKNDMEQDVKQVTDQWTAATEAVQQIKVTPKKTDIDVQMVALAWAPAWEITYEDARGRSRTEAVPAYQIEA
ncbi:MAG: ATP-binding protein [Anaerolineae bacterium]